MDIIGLLGIILVAAGVYILITGGVLVGIICIVVGLFLVGGRGRLL